MDNVCDKLAARLKQNWVEYMDTGGCHESSVKIAQSSIEKTIAVSLRELPIAFLEGELTLAPLVRSISKTYYPAARNLRGVDMFKKDAPPQELASIKLLGGLGGEKVSEEKLELGRSLWVPSDTSEYGNIPFNTKLLKEVLAYFVATHHTLKELQDFSAYRQHMWRHHELCKKLEPIVKRPIAELLDMKEYLWFSKQ